MPARRRIRSTSRTSGRWQRLQEPQPGHRSQLDVKSDDYTHIPVLKVYDACNQRTATLFIDEVVRRLQGEFRAERTKTLARSARIRETHLQSALTGL